MPSTFSPRLVALAAAVVLAAAAAPAVAAGPVTVTVNGSTVNLTPPPINKAGRVFVPLRGVFENLGATVVYANGVINATGGRHTISLKIGSPAATVDGQQQTIDVAPFIVGASTYVPLRFVSQALGATVNYDGGNNVVAIATNGRQAAAPAPAPTSDTITPAPVLNGAGAVTFASTQPLRATHSESRTPQIEASLSGTIDPNKTKVLLDGLDVTADTSRSPRGISYAPRSPLQSGEHLVRVSGVGVNGVPFSRAWNFWTP
jgi:hypothetical protein